MGESIINDSHLRSNTRIFPENNSDIPTNSQSTQNDQTIRIEIHDLGKQMTEVITFF